MNDNKHNQQKQQLKREEKDLTIVRFDLKTRISVVAGFIYGAGYPEITIEKAVEEAARLDGLADQKVRDLKFHNRVDPGDNKAAYALNAKAAKE